MNNIEKRRRKTVTKYYRQTRKTVIKIWLRKSRYVIKKSEEYIRPPIIDEGRKLTVAGTGKGQITPQYSTGEVKIPPKTMGEDQVPPQKYKGVNQITPEYKDDEQNLSLNRNGEDEIPPKKEQVDIRKILKEPYEDVSTFEQTDSITLFMKKNDKVDSSFGLTPSRMCPINRASDTGIRPSLPRENLVKPNRLL